MTMMNRKGYAYMVYDDTEDYRDKAWQPDWRPYKAGDNDERIFIGAQDLVIEVPDDFDPRPGAVAALEAKKVELAGKYQAALNEINNRISKLQAITHEAAE